jgi:hypothetical protein
MRLPLFSIFLFLSGFTVLSQPVQNKILLDSAIKFSGRLFVNSEPTKVLNIYTKEIWRYNNSYVKILNQKGIDTTLIFQVIDNSKHLATATWTDDELSNVILINNLAEQINLESALQKLKPVTKKQAKYYTKKIKEYNASQSYRDTYTVSRPVYDNSHQYAIIQTATSGWGGGYVMIYHLSDGIWKTCCKLSEWIN